MRYHDWCVRLSDVIDQSINESFAWGKFDCRVFACRCVFAVCGRDYSKEFSDYESSIMAKHIVEQTGSLERCVSLILKSESIHPAFARRGDVVLAISPPGDALGETLGICLGAHFAFVAERGLSMLTLEKIKCAWRID